MRKFDYLGSFFAGLGIGVAASVLLAPEAGGKARSRIRDIASRAGNFLKEHAENLGEAPKDALRERQLSWRDEQTERSHTISDLKDKTKEKIDDAADAARKAAGKVVDKSRDVAHSAGRKMEEGAERLENA